MPSNPAGKRKWRLTLARRYGLLAAAWLIVITLLHCSLNMHRQDRDLVRMGYMPVVTNLAAPLLDFVSRDEGPIVSRPSNLPVLPKWRNRCATGISMRPS